METKKILPSEHILKRKKRIKELNVFIRKTTQLSRQYSLSIAELYQPMRDARKLGHHKTANKIVNKRRYWGRLMDKMIDAECNAHGERCELGREVTHIRQGILVLKGE